MLLYGLEYSYMVLNTISFSVEKGYYGNECFPLGSLSRLTGLRHNVSFEESMFEKSMIPFGLLMTWYH